MNGTGGTRRRKGRSPCLAVAGWGQHVALRTLGEDLSHMSRKSSLLATVQLWRGLVSPSCDPFNTDTVSSRPPAAHPTPTPVSSGPLPMTGPPDPPRPLHRYSHILCPAARLAINCSLPPGGLPPGLPPPACPCNWPLAGAFLAQRSAFCCPAPADWPPWAQPHLLQGVWARRGAVGQGFPSVPPQLSPAALVRFL